MTERDPDTERYAYSRRALARLVLSDALATLADQAEDGVSTVADEYSRPGEKVELAADVVTHAKEALVRAVVYERQRGTSWDLIGDSLDITRQSAHARFAGYVDEWETDLAEPYKPAQTSTGTIFTPQLPEAAQSPAATGKYLDDWLATRGRDDHAATAGLPALSTVEQMNEVLAGLRHLYRAGTAADPVARAQLLDRKADLLDRIATEEDRPEAAAQADEARAAATGLRAEADTHHKEKS